MSLGIIRWCTHHEPPAGSRARALAFRLPLSAALPPLGQQPGGLGADVAALGDVALCGSFVEAPPAVRAGYQVLRACTGLGQVYNAAAHGGQVAWWWWACSCCCLAGVEWHPCITVRGVPARAHIVWRGGHGVGQVACLGTARRCHGGAQLPALGLPLGHCPLRCCRGCGCSGGCAATARLGALPAQGWQGRRCPKPAARVTLRGSLRRHVHRLALGLEHLVHSPAQ